MSNFIKWWDVSPLINVGETQRALDFFENHTGPIDQHWAQILLFDSCVTGQVVLVKYLLERLKSQKELPDYFHPEEVIDYMDLINDKRKVAEKIVSFFDVAKTTEIRRLLVQNGYIGGDQFDFQFFSSLVATRLFKPGLRRSDTVRISMPIDLNSARIFVTNEETILPVGEVEIKIQNQSPIHFSMSDLTAEKAVSNTVGPANLEPGFELRFLAAEGDLWIIRSALTKFPSFKAVVNDYFQTFSPRGTESVGISREFLELVGQSRREEALRLLADKKSHVFFRDFSSVIGEKSGQELEDFLNAGRRFINCLGSSQESLLFKACCKNDEERVGLLLATGADPNFLHTNNMWTDYEGEVNCYNVTSSKAIRVLLKQYGFRLDESGQTNYLQFESLTD